MAGFLSKIAAKNQEAMAELNTNFPAPPPTVQSIAQPQTEETGSIPDEVFSNLVRLRDGIANQLPELPIIMQAIHAQLIQIPGLVHLLDDEQIADIVEATAVSAKVQITPAAKEKTTKKKVAQTVKEAKSMDFSNLRLEDF